MAAATGPAHASGRLVRGHLPRGAGHAPDHRVLDHRPLHDADRAVLEPRQLPDHHHRLDVLVDHRPDRRDRDPGHGDGRSARFPVRVLHGSRRHASRADAALRRGPVAAVGELPRARVCVDPHPQPQRGPELEPAVDRPAPRQHRLHQHGHVAGVLLHLAALHDHPGLRGPGARAGVADGGVGGPGRAKMADTARRGPTPAAPGVVAGSIFTFSLTLGDYITPILVGGASSTFIGNVVYANVGIANNIPFAAALSMVPLGIMAVYLFIAYRLGAFEAL